MPGLSKSAMCDARVAAGVRRELRKANLDVLTMRHVLGALIDAGDLADTREARHAARREVRRELAKLHPPPTCASQTSPPRVRLALSVISQAALWVRATLSTFAS